MTTPGVPAAGRDSWAQIAWNSLWLCSDDAYITLIDGVKCLPIFLERASEAGDSHIYLRKEYDDVWEETFSYYEQPERKCGGMVVWGSPGIGANSEQLALRNSNECIDDRSGKSSFLRYALARALQPGCRVILCENSTYVLYFSEIGVRRIESSDFFKFIYPRGILALFDITDVYSFVEDRSWCPFLVHATSPDTDRWSRWAKRLKPRLWVMQPWSLDEIEALQRITSTLPNSYTPLEIFEYRGPSARHCCTNTEKTGNPDLDFDFDLLDIRNPQELLNQITSMTVVEGSQRKNFHKYLYAFRRPGVKSFSYLNSSASRYDYIIPTKFLKRRLFGQLQSQTLEKQREMCSRFSPLPRICGAPFEVLGVYFLGMQSHAMALHFDDHTTTLPANLPISALPSLLPTLSTTFPNVLWIPPDGNPTIDAVAVTDGGRVISLLQMTIASEHLIKPQGIAKIWTLLGEHASRIQWRFLFVVPSAEIGKKLCRKRKEISQRSPAPLEAKSKGRVKSRELIKMPVGYAVVSFLTNQELESILGNFEYLPQDEVGSVIEIDMD